MKVRAIKIGFYGKRRREGDEFEIDSEKHFSEQWMEKVESEKKSRTRSKPAKPEEDSNLV